MEDVSQIDFKKPFSKVVEVKPERITKQKIFFMQNGIGYGLDGKAVDQKQVQAHYANVAKEAQAAADEAMETAKALQAQASEVAKAGGVTKTQARKG